MATQQTPQDQSTNKNEQREKEQDLAAGQPTSTQQYDELMEESDRNRTRKPGSQSNSSDQNNNGRGGGK